jgi:hypothetical protein
MAGLSHRSPSRSTGPPSVPSSLHARSPSSPVLDSRFLRSPDMDGGERSVTDQTLSLPLASTVNAISPCTTPRPERHKQLAREDWAHHRRRRAVSFDFGRNAWPDSSVAEPSLTMSILARRTRRPPHRSEQTIAIEPSSGGSARRWSFACHTPRGPRHISTEDRYASPEPGIERSQSTPTSSFVFPQVRRNSRAPELSFSPIGGPTTRESLDRRSWALTRSISTLSELGPSIRRDAPVLQRPPAKRRADRPVQSVETNVWNPHGVDESQRAPSSIATDLRTTVSTDWDSSPSHEFSPADAPAEDDTGSPITSASIAYVTRDLWPDPHVDSSHSQHADADDNLNASGYRSTKGMPTPTAGLSTLTNRFVDSTAFRGAHDQIRLAEHEHQPHLDPLLRQASIDKDAALYRVLRTSAFASAVPPFNGAEQPIYTQGGKHLLSRASSLTTNTEDVFSFDARPRTAAASAMSFSSASVSSGGRGQSGEGLHVDQGGLMGSVELGSEGGHFGPAIREKVQLHFLPPALLLSWLSF